MTTADTRPPAPSLADLISAGPSGGTVDERLPIGVPRGYIVTTPGADIHVEGIGYRPGVPQVVGPSFFDGDEYLPATLSAEDRARLQMRLYTLGVLDKDFQVGVWDAPSRLAYRSVLEFANGAGIADVGAALAQYGNLLDVSAARGVKREPLVIRQTSPEDIRRVVEATASQVLGRKADDGQVERIVAAYHASEAAAQQQAYDITPAGGTVTEPPAVATFAEDQLRQQNPTEAGAYAVADTAVQNFLGLVQGPFGGA